MVGFEKALDGLIVFGSTSIRLFFIREEHRKDAAQPLLASNQDRGMVFLQDVHAHPKTQTRAVVTLSRKKRFENSPQRSSAHPAPGICDRHSNPL